MDRKILSLVQEFDPKAEALQSLAQWTGEPTYRAIGSFLRYDPFTLLNLHSSDVLSNHRAAPQIEADPLIGLAAFSGSVFGPETALGSIFAAVFEQMNTDHSDDCCCPGCHDDHAHWRDEAATYASSETLPDGNSAAPAVSTLSEMAAYLHTGYFARNVHFNLSDAGSHANSGVLYYNVSGYSGLGAIGDDTNGISNDRKELVREIFKVYGETLGITFVETTGTGNQVDIFFSDNNGGAYAGYTRASGGEIDYSYVSIAAGWSGGTATYDDYTLQTYFHEIGHALGLGHQGPYDGSGSYGSDAIFEYDNWQATMMSYFSQTQNTAVTASYEFLQTPMSVDWIALQSKYGSQSLGGFDFGVGNAFAGDTVYGFNTNITSGVSDIWARFADFADSTASTIVDGGGIDTLDFSGYAAVSNIDLSLTDGSDARPSISDIGGRIGNLTLAEGTVIENAIGGSANDTFIGNAADNRFEGRGGDDMFTDSAGADTYLGGSGSDTIDFAGNSSSYSFDISGSFLEVINVSIDLADASIEWLSFDDQTLSFDDAWASAGGANVAPVGNNDSFAVTGDTLNSNVLTNDSDANGDVLSVSKVNNSAALVGTSIQMASGALVTVNSDGAVTYDRNGAFAALPLGDTAVESVTYAVTDGAASDTASATFTISGTFVNQSPKALNNSFSVDEDVELSGLNVLGNDSDPEGDALTIVKIAGTTVSSGSHVTLSSGARVTLNANGTLRYDQRGAFDVLDVGESGSDSFSYRVSDGELTDAATVTITINGAFDNQAPIAVNDTKTVAENSQTIGNVLNNDSDPDGATLTVAKVAGVAADVGKAVTLASGATILMRADGRYDFDPNGAYDSLSDGESAVEAILYQVTDGQGGTDSATLRVTVTGVSPVVAPPGPEVTLPPPSPTPPTVEDVKDASIAARFGNLVVKITAPDLDLGSFKSLVKSGDFAFQAGVGGASVGRLSSIFVRDSAPLSQTEIVEGADTHQAASAITEPTPSVDAFEFIDAADAVADPLAIASADYGQVEGETKVAQLVEIGTELLAAQTMDDFIL